MKESISKLLQKELLNFLKGIKLQLNSLRGMSCLKIREHNNANISIIGQINLKNVEVTTEY